MQKILTILVCVFYVNIYAQTPTPYSAKITSISGGGTINTPQSGAHICPANGDSAGITAYAGWPFGTNGYLYISNGNTQHLVCGSIADYDSIKIDVGGTLTNTASIGINANFTGGNSANIAFRGLSSKISGTGLNGTNTALRGESSGTSLGTNYGVNGRAQNGATNFGLYGYSSGSNLNFNVGVAGKADTVGGSSVVNRAIDGTSSGTAGFNQGVFGRADGINTAYDNYGVFGYAINSSINNFGLFGQADQPTAGANYGIYAIATAGTINYAGYFDGDVTVNGTFTNPSDERLKTNITNLNSVLPLLAKINPISYTFKSASETHNLNLPKNLQYGFSAQEISRIFPTLVVENIAPKKINKNVQASSNSKLESNPADEEPFTYKSVNYIGLIPVLTQAIKEQQLQIEQLKNEMAEIKALLKNK